MWVFIFLGTDPTRITQGPVDMEIIVGESIVLPCQVVSDPVLDVSFSWAFNGQLISKGDSHFELVGGVSDRSHTSWKCANGQLAPLPVLLHFISAIRLKRQLVVWHHGIVWRNLLWLVLMGQKWSHFSKPAQTYAVGLWNTLQENYIRSSTLP